MSGLYHTEAAIAKAAHASIASVASHHAELSHEGHKWHRNGLDDWRLHDSTHREMSQCSTETRCCTHGKGKGMGTGRNFFLDMVEAAIRAVVATPSPFFLRIMSKASRLARVRSATHVPHQVSTHKANNTSAHRLREKFIVQCYRVCKYLLRGDRSFAK